MDLKTYLAMHKIKAKDFGEKIDYGRSQLSAIMNDKRKPGKKLSKAIERATNGEVRYE